MTACQPGLREPVQSKCSPIRTMVVPCYEIPTTPRRDKAVRLDESSAALALTSPLFETNGLVVTTCRSEHTECFGIDDVVICPPHGTDARMQCRHTSA